MKPAAAVAPGVPCARFAGLVGANLVEVTDDAGALDSSGRWAVVVTFEGRLTAARFADWGPAPPQAVGGPWLGPGPGDWRSSLDRSAYEHAVGAIRDSIGRGDVYQANLCRVLHARLPHAGATDLGGLHVLLAAGNPAPYGGFVRLPGLQVATASPELFVQRDGDQIRTGPIKGTARTVGDLQHKDQAENIMIVDLMRNDFSRVCHPGTVFVPRLLSHEHHPGLVHLVSQVEGALRSGTGWLEILSALHPPGSVSGAPKASALHLLSGLEPVERGPYCGAVGWVDADEGTAELAVGIRTFWTDTDGSTLRFGTGAGITWGSVAAAEWDETELKAAHLLQVARGTWGYH